MEGREYIEELVLDILDVVDDDSSCDLRIITGHMEFLLLIVAVEHIEYVVEFEKFEMLEMMKLDIV